MKKIVLAITVLGINSISILANDSYKSSVNKTYINECSSCHMSYQAEFLPKRSWKKMMDNLNNHFAVDATVEKEDEIIIRKYLNENASDAKYTYGEIEEFSDSIYKSSTPLSISEIPKFIREHDEIPQKFINQKEVKFFSNCTACHKDAKQGGYKERNIYIPNFGRWDD